MQNLDAMTPEELMEFWHRHDHGRKHDELFPDKPAGHYRATANLASYASNKATAMRCRERGDVEVALMYEGICDRIYKQLPTFARW